MPRILSIILVLCSLLTIPCRGEINHVFDSRVRTVSLRNPDSFMSPPLIRLGSDDRLRLNFDILGDSHEYLRCRLVHCNADWRPSNLLPSEYVSGFNEAQIDDFAYSANTFTHFVNYNFDFPNPDLQPLASGNYILEVFNEDEPDKNLLQVGFSVSDNAIPVVPSMTTATDRGFNTEWQQLEIKVGIKSGENIDPYQDLVVTVEQNNRPETARTLRTPLSYDFDFVTFAHNPDLIFPAGNEYRRFETVRPDHPGMHVDSVSFEGNNWHAWLTPDQPRRGRNYIYDRTQHGRFMVDEFNATDPDIGADYVTVHFALDVPELRQYDIYVLGDFATNGPTPSNRMIYDPDRRQYIAEIPLKQGSYNYQYFALPKAISSDSDYSLERSLSPESSPLTSSKSRPDPSVIEGNFYETSNEYLVKVFLRKPGTRADRLLGASLLP